MFLVQLNWTDKKYVHCSQIEFIDFTSRLRVIKYESVREQTVPGSRWEKRCLTSHQQSEESMPSPSVWLLYLTEFARQFSICDDEWGAAGQVFIKVGTSCIPSDTKSSQQSTLGRFAPEVSTFSLHKSLEQPSGSATDSHLASHSANCLETKMRQTLRGFNHLQSRNNRVNTPAQPDAMQSTERPQIEATQDTLREAALPHCLVAAYTSRLCHPAVFLINSTFLREPWAWLEHPPREEEEMYWDLLWQL